jgi:hypothetical protein
MAQPKANRREASELSELLCVTTGVCMNLDACFLSIDEDKPLAIWWANVDGCGAIPLDEFLEESKIDMSKEQAARYVETLQIFVDQLREYASNT